MEGIDRIWQTALAVMLAVAGGLARMLSEREESRRKWGVILSELFVSAFAGYMVMLAARASGLDGDWLSVVSGVSGWLGAHAVDLVLTVVQDKLNLKKKDEGE